LLSYLSVDIFFVSYSLERTNIYYVSPVSSFLTVFVLSINFKSYVGSRIRAVGCGDGEHCGVPWRYGAHQMWDHRLSITAIHLVQGRLRCGQHCRRHYGRDTVQRQDNAVGFQVGV